MHQSDKKPKKLPDKFEEELLIDRRAHMFATLAQRHSKQRGFLKGDDVLNSLNSDVDSDREFIESLNIPSYESLAKPQGQ